MVQIETTEETFAAWFFVFIVETPALSLYSNLTFYQEKPQQTSLFHCIVYILRSDKGLTHITKLKNIFCGDFLLVFVHIFGISVC